MLGSGFLADRSSHLVNQRSVEGSGEADRFRKDSCGSRAGDAVQSFAPPVVFGNLQPRNGARLVDQLRRLFFQRHPGNQVIHTDVDWLRRIEVQRGRRRAERFGLPNSRVKNRKARIRIPRIGWA